MINFASLKMAPESKKKHGKEAHFMLRTFKQTLQICHAQFSGKNLFSRSAPVYQ
jgi:hypothetical protein